MTRQGLKEDALELLKCVIMDATVVPSEVTKFVKHVKQEKSVKTGLEALIANIRSVAEFTTAHEEDKPKIKAAEQDDGSDGDYEDDGSEAGWRQQDSDEMEEEDDLGDPFQAEIAYWNGLSYRQTLKSVLLAGFGCEKVEGGVLYRTRDKLPDEGTKAAYEKYGELVKRLEIETRNATCKPIQVPKSCAKSVMAASDVKFPLTFIVPIYDSAAAGAASKEEPVDGGDNKQAFWSVRESEKDNTILIATRIK
jgi:hypothetical protein